MWVGGCALTGAAEECKAAADCCWVPQRHRKCCIWGVLEGWQARYLVVRKSCCAARVQERQEQQRRAEREAAGKLSWFKLPAVMPMIQENPL